MWGSRPHAEFDVQPLFSAQGSPLSAPLQRGSSSSEIVNLCDLPASMMFRGGFPSKLRLEIAHRAFI